MSLLDAVNAALTAQPPAPGDGAAAELARAYARTMDDPETSAALAADLGPKLLAVLESLQMTPRARAAAQKAGPGEQRPANPIDQLALRRAGLRDPATLDAAAT